jgi:hypothetical protein
VELDEIMLRASIFRDISWIIIIIHETWVLKIRLDAPSGAAILSTR